MFVDVSTVRSYLPVFGYENPTGDDDIIIRHAIERVLLRLKAYTNQTVLPAGLKYEAINMSVAEFLYIKKQTGHLQDGEHGITFPNVIKQFTEGDTNVSANMAGKDDEAMFNNWLEKQRHGDPYIIEHYRRLHW